jgi:hypothetical protein
VVPPAIRRALDGGRLPVMLAVLAAELLALVFFAGVAVGLLVVPPDPGVPRWVVWLVVGTFLAAAGGAVVLVAEVVTRIWWRGRRRRARGRRRDGIRMTVGTAPSGMPATVVARSPASLVTPWGLALVTTGWPLGMAVVTASSPWVSVVFVALAVAAATRLAPLVLGRARAGGVFLTPSALELQWGVRTTTVPWDRLPPAVPGTAVSEVPRAAASAEHRSFPVDVPTDVVDRVPRDVVSVPGTYLWAPASEVWALVELARSRPVLRRHLGTRASLEWHVEPPSSPVS